MLDKLLKNIVPVIFGLGVLVILTFLFVLVLTGRDVEAYLGSISTLVQLTISSGLLGGLLTRIGKNVNGNQTALQRENAELRAAISATPNTGPVMMMSDESLQRIDSDKNKLPSH